VSLTAYSGGTVWDLHPLRVAAGANVVLWRRVYRNLWEADLYSPDQLSTPPVCPSIGDRIAGTLALMSDRRVRLGQQSKAHLVSGLAAT